MTRIATPIVLAAALFAAPVPAQAQVATDCPEIEGGAAHPVELRIGDLVLRAEVRTDHADTAGTRIEGRLISCERERVIGDTDADATDSPDLADVATVLRLLNDFRVAFELGATDEAGCIRAGVAVQGAGGQRPAAAAERPLAVEICGLPPR